MTEGIAKYSLMAKSCGTYQFLLMYPGVALTLRHTSDKTYTTRFASVYAKEIVS